MKKIDWLIIFFIFIASLFTLSDLFQPGFYTSHDGIHQVVRLFYFDQALRDGQFPPRFVSDLLYGYGYPLFVFSYHLPWFIGEVFHLLGLSIFASVKAVFIFGFILSGITMYIFQKNVFGRLAGFFGTIIYLYAPYRFSNIFVRAAIGDATVLIFPPVVFLSFLKLIEKKKIDWIWLTIGAVSIAGMVLSHAMVAFFFIACFIVFGLYTFFQKKQLRVLGITILMNVFGFGLCAYYFIPSLFERDYTKFNEIMKYTYIGKYFVNFKELLYSSWGYGVMHSPEGAMSLQLGVGQWLVFITAVFTLAYCLFKKPKNTVGYNLAKYFFVVFIITIFLMLPVSLPLWYLMNNVVLIDFPWRILSLTIFSSSILAGFIVTVIRKKIFKVIFIFLVILICFYTNRNHLRINQTLDWSLDFFLKLEKTTNSYDEYTPKWFSNPSRKPFGKAEFISGNSRIVIDKKTSNYLSLDLNAQEDGIIRLNTMYYPGWSLFVNGVKQDIKYDNGLIESKVQKGGSRIEAKFTENPLRIISNTLSVIFAVILLICIYRKRII